MEFIIGSTGRLCHGVVHAAVGGTAAPLAVLVPDGESQRGDAVYHIPEVGLGCRRRAANGDRTTRTRHLAQHAQHVHLQHGSRREVDIQVGAQVAANILVLCGITVGSIIILDESLVGEQVQHREIAEALTTATKLHTDLVGRTILAESLIHPVHIRILIRIAAAPEGVHLFRRIAGSRTLISQSLVHSTGEGGTIDKLRTVSLEVKQVVVGDTNVLTVVLTAFRGDEDGTIRTLIAIERYSGSIFQNADVIDLLGIDEAEVALHTIDQYQRCARTQTLKATDIERGILFEVRTRALQRYQSVALSENRIADILGRTFVHIPVGNHRDGCRRLGTGEILIGTHLDDLVHEAEGCAVLLSCCWQAQACKQRQHKYISFLHNHFS